METFQSLGADRRLFLTVLLTSGCCKKRDAIWYSKTMVVNRFDLQLHSCGGSVCWWVDGELDELQVIWLEKRKRI